MFFAVVSAQHPDDGGSNSAGPVITLVASVLWKARKGCWSQRWAEEKVTTFLNVQSSQRFLSFHDYPSNPASLEDKKYIMFTWRIGYGFQSRLGYFLIPGFWDRWRSIPESRDSSWDSALLDFLWLTGVLFVYYNYEQLLQLFKTPQQWFYLK